MDDVKGFVKSYWPYILGGVAGIYLVMRYSGGSSQGNGTAQFLAAQAQAGAATQQAGAQSQAIQAQAESEKQQLNMQSKALQAQIDAQNRQGDQAYELSLMQMANEQSTLDKSIDAQMKANEMDFTLGLKQLDVTQNEIHLSSMNNFLMTQSAMAESTSQGAAALVGQLTAPSIHAMNAAATENAAAMQAAAYAAGSGYIAQSEMVKGTTSMIGDISKSLGATNNAIGALASRSDNKVTVGSLAQQAVGGYFGAMGSGMGAGGYY